MTDAVYLLLCECVARTQPDEFVLTRRKGGAVRDFRKTWQKACTGAGLGKMFCAACSVPVLGRKCGKCDSTNLSYRGLIFHDLRRTASRNLRRAGVAEGVIQKIGGWKTRSVFERYAIGTQTDIAEAMRKLQSQHDGHSFGHSDTPKDSSTESRQTN